MKHLITISLLVTLGAGCKKSTPEAPPAAKAPAATAEHTSEPAPANSPPPGQPSDPANANAAEPAQPVAPANAEGGAVAAPTTATECPKSLSGTDAIDRTIASACGTVPVTAEYRVDGGTLTIEAGVTLAFEAGAALRVGEFAPAKLVVKGTAEKPVTFTSAKDKAAGAWVGVVLASQAARSSVEHAVIEYAGAADGPALRVEATDVAVSGTTIRHSRGGGLEISGDHGAAEVSGCTFGETVGPAIRTTFPASRGIGANSFTVPEKALVEVVGGTATKSFTWRATGAPWVVLDDVRVDGADTGATWTIAPGNTVRLDNDANILIGEFAAGELVAKGATEGGLVRFEPRVGTEPGSWGAIRIGAQGKLVLEAAIVALAGAEGTGALQLADRSKARVVGASFVKPKGVAVRADAEAFVEAFESVTFTDASPSLEGWPGLLSGLGKSNVYGAGGRVVINAGVFPKGPNVWRAQGTPVELRGELHVDTELTLEAGGTYVVAEGGSVTVGAFAPGSLEIKGTSEAPVSFAGFSAESTWPGLRVGTQGKATVRHTTFANTGEAAVFVTQGGRATLENVKAAATTVAWECGATVERTAVTSDGPAAEKPPEGCP